MRILFRRSRTHPSAFLFENGKRGSVLLVTLAFVLLVTVMAVAFLVRSRSSLQTSQSYSREMIAKEVGEVGINTIIAQFQKESSTNLTNSTNRLLPLRTGMAEQNPRLSPLIRQTTDTNGISTDTPAKNGWTFNRSRWMAPALLTANQSAAQTNVPQWVYVYGQSDSSSNNSKNVIGRYAAMIYDVGGLLDINEVGVPNSVSKGDKGAIAFADLSALPGGASLTIADWRDPSGTALDYYGNSTVTDPRQAGRIESPTAKMKSGQNRFFSRMELVEAAKAGKLGLSESLLPLLRTRSEAGNRLTVENIFAYGTNTTIDLAHNDLKAANDTTFIVDRIDGRREACTIKAGQSLIQNRFSLARLRWLADREADGTPRHQPEIKKYFGLTWDPANKIFIYTSPDGTAAADKIKTLKDLAIQINGPGPVREPDFFECLKAAINPDSLGQTGGSTDRLFQPVGSIAGTGSKVAWEISKDLHLLRIGANIIDQSDPDSIPTGIRSTFIDVDPKPFDSFGQENLPYVNEVITSALRDGNNLKGYMQFELWNPSRNAATGADYPRDYQGNKMSEYRVRIIKGRVLMEPMVYMTSPGGNDFKVRNPSGIPGDTSQSLLNGLPNNTQENNNNPWSSLKRIVEYSQRGLTAADFDSPDLAGSAILFSLGGNGAFFNEPYLVNGNLAANNSMEDLTVGTSTDMEISRVVSEIITLKGILGAAPDVGSTPDSGRNALLLCTVKASNPNFSGIKGTDLWTSKMWTDWKANPAANPRPAWYTWFDQSCGAKAWNAVQFYSDQSEPYQGLQTEPVTFALEVKVGEDWHTCQIYNNLALGGRGAGGNGLQAVVLDGDPGTKNVQATAVDGPGFNWTSASDTSSRCFSRWTAWEIRKAYPNTDPRTERFGLTDQMYSSPGLSIRANTDTWKGNGGTWNFPNGLTTSVGTSFLNTTAFSNEGPAPGWSLFVPNGTGVIQVSIPSDLALNSGATQTHSYKDSDGITRPADARWVPEDAHPALPVASFAKAAESRPVFLNRPFRSVAELGAVFRDIPWKSLDLFSPDSPDRRLLDVFSVEDRATVTGKINPNLATEETLKALLRGASLDPSSAGASSVANSDADAVASIFSTLDPASNPVLSSANMTARLSTNSVSKPDGGFSPYKTRAENFIRALSSTTDTRSWQLMLDVVAQSGRVTPQDGPLTSFVVEGQKRFFVYLTLDRITGEIVDKHIEPVYE